MVSVVLDVAGPALLVAFGVIFGGLLSLLILVVETLLLWRLHWASFWRALLGAFAANLASGIVGFMGLSVYLVRNEPPGLLFYIGAFILSIPIEAGVLMLFKRNATRENWRAALIINIASYALLAVAVLIWRAASAG